MNKVDQEKIGKFIKEIRQKEKLSQQKFAQKYGVTYQAVSKWECGKNIPDISILKKMCEEYNMNLDDFLKTDLIKSKKKANKVIILLFLAIVVFSLLICYLKFPKDSFKFKTLSTSCENFNLYGSIAYNDRSSSIYISNITHCGESDDNLYKKIECTLYETEDKRKNIISTYNFNGNSTIDLDQFLKNVEFRIDNYEYTCKNLEYNSLHLEIDATDERGNVISYKIPLELEENCNK